MARYHLLNVFTDRDGQFGNPLAVFLDGAGVVADDRQRIARELGLSETVFVEDAERGVVRIHTPESELPLAGHPLVGSAWLLARELGECTLLRPPAGEVPTWAEGDVRWIRARPEWAPHMESLELDSPAAVDALEQGPAPYGFVDCWAWLDEDAGLLRSRVFVPAEGIPEDEATGAAALRLTAQLGRPVEIHQGRGSVLHARPGPDGTVEVGGRVLYEGERDHG